MSCSFLFEDLYNGTISGTCLMGDTAGNETLLSTAQTCCQPTGSPTLDATLNECHYSYCKTADDSQKSIWTQCASSHLMAKGIKSLDAITYGCDNASFVINETITAVLKATPGIMYSTLSVGILNMTATAKPTSASSSPSPSKSHSRATYTLPTSVVSKAIISLVFLALLF